MRGTGAVLMLAIVVTLATMTASATGALSPLRLRCEYAVNPLGIDAARPRLSWGLHADRRDEKQTAYQILAAGSSERLDRDQGDFWDSGKVSSDQNVHVVYDGSSLLSGARVYWKVRVWDRDDQVSAYSEPAWWEMGLLKPSDWTARWIACDELKGLGAGLQLGQWIWVPDAPAQVPTAFFRRSFDLAPSMKIAEAIIKLNADNAFELYVNGGFVGGCRYWDMPREYDVTPDVRPGLNVIAVKVVNSVDPGGLRAALRIRFVDGRLFDLASDADWLVNTTEQTKWQEPDFDQSTWQHAVVLPADKADRWKQIQDPFGPPRSVCLRKVFALSRRVVRARACASGLGLYELYVNGHRVGDDVFAPGWTDYSKRVQYQVYDVTALLHEGENAVGAILGNGWFSGDLGWTRKPPFSQGPLRFILQLEIEYDDGTRERVVTDRTWQTHTSPITRNTFFNGETYDARLEMPGWATPTFIARDWVPAIELEQGGKLVAEQCEPIRVTEELRAVQITEPAAGVYVFDFGQNAAGYVRLSVRGPRGTWIRLRFAEILRPDGQLYRDNLRAAEATDYYILKGEGQEIWEPTFTYHGFRYCEVTGYPGKPTVDSLAFRVLHSAAAPAGRFECSNPLLNQIWRNVTWSQRSNMYSVWTDCPQRDERMGWTGDAVAMAPTACWNMHMARFFTKWMRDLTDGQGEDGGVPDIAPAVYGSGAGSPGWSDAITTVPWTVYQFYGDKGILEENYEAMTRWVEFMGRHSKDHLYQRDGYGDWIAPAQSPKPPMAAAYYYHSTDLLAKAAAAIGRTDDARKYADLAGRIAEAFNHAYFDKQTRQYQGSTQTANVLPLYFGLVPPAETAAVVQNVVRDIESRGDHLSTGFQGTAYLMPVLARYGQQEVAYRLAVQTTYPSWGYMVKQGATTIWELWDADKRGPEMNSRNHAALGAVGRWFFEGLAGINIDPAEPGFRHIIVRPTPVGGLTSVEAEYESIRGLVASRWRAEGERFTLNVVVPVGSRATVFLPAAKASRVTETGRPVESAGGVHLVREEGGAVVCEIGSGSYEFEVVSP
ncbi:MAG TPA: family 78 glycoside hydrolase catalytic domain [Phycisphaerae bacterium]|nr:family 78 glycoside hydrolase catalytic domain [Phycisphaerae bacterium]HRR85409.1 family 78 glycoside hydrolase catalytic domain [Phycisphaerae bacterium]